MIGGEFRLIPIDESYDAPKPGHYVIPDTIPDTWHPATGQMCSSRTGMVKIAKAHGLEELGNERIKPREYKPDKAKIREAAINAYERIRNRRNS